MTRRKTQQGKERGKSSEWPLGDSHGEISGEPSEKPQGEQGGDAPGNCLAKPALQVADEPIENKW